MIISGWPKLVLIGRSCSEPFSCLQQSLYLVIMQCWLNTQISPSAMNLSLSSAVVKLNTIEEWDLASRHSWLPSQHGGLAWWSLSYSMMYSMSSLCISALLCTLPSESFVLSMLTLAQKYSISGRADMSVLPIKIFLIFSEWLSKSPAIPLAMAVIIRFPFLDQLTAIAQKYMGTSSVSSSALISLRAMSVFLCSISRIGGLNCSIRQCGLACVWYLLLLVIAVGLLWCYRWV